MCSQGSHEWGVSIGLDNGLVLIVQQAITWTNDGPDLQHHINGLMQSRYYSSASAME